jgi:hypothetical protein
MCINNQVSQRVVPTKKKKVVWAPTKTNSLGGVVVLSQQMATYWEEPVIFELKRK